VLEGPRGLLRDLRIRRACDEAGCGAGAWAMAAPVALHRGDLGNGPNGPARVSALSEARAVAEVPVDLPPTADRSQLSSMPARDASPTSPNAGPVSARPPAWRSTQETQP
jgi:hypothetical protein